MKRLFAKMKQDKWFFVLMIALLVNVVFSLFVLCFDIVQLKTTSLNSANLSAGFLPLNIIFIVFNVLMMCYAFVYFRWLRK